MNRDHSLIEEFLAADALGGLDPNDRERLDEERAHHGDCPTCADLEARFSATAGRMAFALDPVQVRAGMADDIVAGRGAAAVDLTDRRVRRPTNRRALIAVAAALALLVGGIGIGNELAGGERTAILTGEGTPARLSMTYTPGDSGADLSGTGFDPLPGGQVYELWAIRDATPVSATCFTPTSGRVDLSIDTIIEPTDVMAVTVESAACPDAPTTTPILTADLSKSS